jgi:hypothetical protein
MSSATIYRREMVIVTRGSESFTGAFASLGIGCSCVGSGSGSGSGGGAGWLNDRCASSLDQFLSRITKSHALDDV